MSPARPASSERVQQLRSDLYELVAALDRRVPQLDRPAEAQIAHDASDLRERAVSLIQRIETGHSTD